MKIPVSLIKNNETINFFENCSFFKKSYLIRITKKSKLYVKAKTTNQKIINHVN